MHRRHLLRSALALASAWSLPAFAGTGPEVVVLWPGAPPGGGGPGGPLRVTRSGRVTDVAAPILEVFRPSAVSVAPNGAAVLVASGGGYKAIENGKEGYPAAAWLAARGVTAFVLSYRLPGEGWGAGRLAPFQDAQRAMRLIRSDPAVDRARVGALGFSAGGHLMGMTAAWPEHPVYAPVDAADAHSVRPDARPDAVALIYPVITLEPPYDATSTRRQLVGDDPSAALSAEWSVQTHVRRAMPATFLAQAADDAVSNPENTAIMEAACRAAGVPVERHLYSSGGHGFGMGRPGTPTVAWPDRYEAWLRARGMVG